MHDTDSKHFRVICLPPEAHSDPGVSIQCLDITSDYSAPPVHSEVGSMANPLHHQEPVWASTYAWLQNAGLSCVDTWSSSLAKECWTRIQLMLSDSLIPGFSNAILLLTRRLAALLGTAWLDDKVINTGGKWIMGQLGEHTHSQIVNCLFPSHLVNMRA